MTEAGNFADWLAICNVKAAYCRHLDRKDWESLKALLIENCSMDTRPSGGSLIEGRDVFIAMVSGSLSDAQTVHHVHSPEITFEGDRATAIWAMQDRVKKAGFDLTGYGHYHETYLRTDLGWKITSQVLTRLLVELERV